MPRNDKKGIVPHNDKIIKEEGGLNAPLFHPHLIPLPSREREIILPGKYGGRENYKEFCN